MKILYTGDFILHENNEDPAFHCFNDLVFKSIRSLGFEVEPLKSNFQRSKFFKLSNIENQAPRYFRPSTKISSESKDYLKSKVGDSIIFGFELNKQSKDLFNEIGARYINCWIHPFKLLDDLAFAFESNDDQIKKSLESFSQPKEKLELYANYWKVRVKRNFRKPNIAPNSLLLVGQSESDQSLIYKEKMLSLNDYQEEISELKKSYKLLYSPHPKCLDRFGRLSFKRFPNLKEFLKKNEIAISLDPVYSLLACDEIKKVVAISSSVVFEAKFFGKESDYLFQPLFDDSICILQDYLYPHFWSSLLKSEDMKEIKFDVMTNKIRDIGRNGGLYWGYRKLDNVRLLLDSERIRNKNPLRKIYRAIFGLNTK